jgi:transcriptional regulator of arginine metabolism
MSRPNRTPRAPRETPEPEIELDLEIPELPGLLDGTLRERRAQRQKLITELINEETMKTQNQIQEALFERLGIMLTQSSISRDLRDLGVRRVKGTYVMGPAKREAPWTFESVLGLIEAAARSGPTNTVIQTAPSAARLVARAIREDGWEEILGVIADDDTLFVATRTEEDQNRLFDRLKRFLKG